MRSFRSLLHRSFDGRFPRHQTNALTGIKSTFVLNPLIVEVVTSWVTLGALLGPLAGGELGDRIGRKRPLLIAGALFSWAPRFRPLRRRL